MAKYKVMGLRKPEYRPAQPGEKLVPEEIIQADSPEKAKAIFEKKHFQFKATVCEPVTNNEPDKEPKKKDPEDAKTDSKPTK